MTAIDAARWADGLACWARTTVLPLLRRAVREGEVLARRVDLDHLACRPDDSCGTP